MTLVVDDENGQFCVDGKPLHDENGSYTAVGHAYRQREIKALGECVELADEEINYFRERLAETKDDPAEQELMERILAKSIEEREALFRYKQSAERLYLMIAGQDALTGNRD